MSTASAPFFTTRWTTSFSPPFRRQLHVVHVNLHLGLGAQIVLSIEIRGLMGRRRIKQHGVVLGTKRTADNCLNLRSQRHNLETLRRGHPWPLLLRNPALGEETPSAQMPVP